MGDTFRNRHAGGKRDVCCCRRENVQTRRWEKARGAQIEGEGGAQNMPRQAPQTADARVTVSGPSREWVNAARPQLELRTSRYHGSQKSGRIEKNAYGAVTVIQPAHRLSRTSL